MDAGAGFLRYLVESTQAVGFWSGTGTAPLRAHPQRMAMAQNVSSLHRKRIFVPLVPDFHLRHVVLDFLLCRRASPARRIANSKPLGYVDLLVLSAPAC